MSRNIFWKIAPSTPSVAAATGLTSGALEFFAQFRSPWRPDTLGFVRVIAAATGIKLLNA